jgi:predicted ATP-grasp superfamily ATP-dependent carboligase
MAKVRIIEAFEPKKKVKTAITGFAGVGFVGNTALMYTARVKGYRLLAYVKSPLVPSMMLLVNGVPTPPFRIYIDDKDSLLFIITETMVPSQNSWSIIQELMIWLEGKGVKEYISFEGIPFSTPSQQTLGFTTGDMDLEKLNIQPTGEGAITGLNATLMEKAMDKKRDWTSIFIPARFVNNIDYQGAIDAVDIINRMFELDVDISPLMKRLESIQKVAQSQIPMKKKGILDRIF